MKGSTCLLGHLVDVTEHKVVVLIKVLARKLPLPDHLVGDLAADVHKELEHVIVRATGKENLAREKLVQRASDSPNVHSSVIRQPKNCAFITMSQNPALSKEEEEKRKKLLTDFRRAVKPGDQVRRDFVLAGHRSRTQIRQLGHRVVGIHLQTHDNNQPAIKERTKQSILRHSPKYCLASSQHGGRHCEREGREPRRGAQRRGGLP